MSKAPAQEKGKRLPRAATWYEYDYQRGTIRFKNKLCSRCGSVMAFHREPAPRWHCGKCDFTHFVKGGA
ncbi:MAG: 30S ribosomal protein S27ae [Thermoproteaceae archaeon]|nr:30S ribosomal protein S27ae [Thermoproteaceae archaeon]